MRSYYAHTYYRKTRNFDEWRLWQIWWIGVKITKLSKCKISIQYKIKNRILSTFLSSKFFESNFATKISGFMVCTLWSSSGILVTPSAWLFTVCGHVHPYMHTLYICVVSCLLLLHTYIGNCNKNYDKLIVFINKIEYNNTTITLLFIASYISEFSQ